jgi:pimeloyl-ACP methyl ester carboxylesterase
MAVLRRDGPGIVYHDVGQGDPPFVFLPEWPCDAATWEQQIADLSRSYRCVAVDLFVDDSGGSAGAHSVEGLADGVAAVLEELGLPPVVVVGHGLGGLVALVMNRRHGQAVCGVVMVDPWLTVVASGELEEVAGRLRSTGDAQVARDFTRRMFGATPPVAVDERLQAALGTLAVPAAADLLESAARLRGELERLLKEADQKPFMALWAPSPLGNPDELRNTTVFLRQEPIPGGSHFFPLEHPGMTSALLRAFVDDVERDPRLQRRD